MSKTIYIFLDVDGVLNSESAFLFNYKQFKKGLSNNITAVIDEQKLIILNDFCETLKKCNLDFKIILSSTWRRSKDLTKILQKRLDSYHLNIDDTTSLQDFNFKSRGLEIEEYCIKHNLEKSNIIIFDDASVLEGFSDRLIKTYFRDGLTYWHTEKALLLLGLLDYVQNPDLR